MPSVLVGDSRPRSLRITLSATGFSEWRISNALSLGRVRPRWKFRPTRREILLCLLTLLSSYTIFYHPQSPTQDPLFLPTAGSSEYPEPDWSIIPSEAEVKPGAVDVDEGESEAGLRKSVRTYGSSIANRSAPKPRGKTILKGRDREGGEEQAEEDAWTGASTTLKEHQAGWTLMDRVYVSNGSLYVVTDRRSDWPDLVYMTSTGLPANNEPGNLEARRPKGHEIEFISPQDALRLWGPRVYRMAGTTWLFNDGQFIDHYYHFSAELLLGTWRTYASLDKNISPTGETSLVPPRRIWFLHQSSTEWRDGPRSNPTVLFALFPSVSLLYPDDWKDIGHQTIAGRPKAFMLERAILADRSAAFYGQYTIPTSRTVASALHVGKTSHWWWEPIRRQILRYSGVDESVIDRNLEGLGAIDPAQLQMPGGGLVLPDPEPPVAPVRYTALVTYISRQRSRRRLTPESHADLLAHLEERSQKIGFELVVVEAETIPLEEQFALAGRTTIMLGVHGNGLTHLIWMPATPRSAVIEMFCVGGFARDYQWTAHALGIRHFGVNHDITFTAPDLPDVNYPEDFQGSSITVDGKTVADLIEDRLAGKI